MRAGVSEQNSLSYKHYRQCKNPHPRFVIPRKKGADRLQTTHPFNRELMVRAEGITSRADFSLRMAMARAQGLRQKAPPPLRLEAIEALMQAVCFHYDFLAERTNVTLRTLATECGLATESDNDNLAITRVTRALKCLERDTGYIRYSEPCGDKELGCYMPTAITLTPAFYQAVEVSSDALEKHITGRVDYQNRKRVSNGLAPLSREEIMAEAHAAFPEFFRSVYRARKEQGEKQARARRDQERSLAEIKALVHRELTYEVAHRHFPRDLSMVKAEIDRRVRERMMMRKHHTRLSHTVPI